MSLNVRQVNFITRLKNFATSLENMYGEAHALVQSHAEEFDDAQNNSFLTSNDDLEAAYFFDSDDVKTAVNQTVNDFLNFWNGDAVNTREHGKDLRRIK